MGRFAPMGQKATLRLVRKRNRFYGSLAVRLSTVPYLHRDSIAIRNEYDELQVARHSGMANAYGDNKNREFPISIQ